MSEIKPCSRENFQYAKGIAILAILISHIGNYSGRTWFTPLGGIGVVIFLFCSGYGVMSSYHVKGLKHYWYNKFISVWIPFAIVEIVAASILRRSITDVTMELVFLKVLFANGWYMQYLAVCYLLFYLGMRFLPNNRVRFILWTMIAILSFLCCDNLRGEQMLSFIGGLAIAELNSIKQMSVNRKQVLIGGCTALVIGGFSFIIRQLPWARSQIEYLYTILNIFSKEVLLLRSS